MSKMEQTLSIIKPDAVERNLVEDIKKNFHKEQSKHKRKQENSNYKRRSF